MWRVKLKKYRRNCNLGGMVFIDLRDEFGITQIVVQDEDLQEQVKELTSESCIHISRKSCGKKQ